MSAITSPIRTSIRSPLRSPLVDKWASGETVVTGPGGIGSPIGLLLVLTNAS